MNPQIATFAFLLGILVLFALYRDRKARTSKALWIPTIWILLAGSRMVSLWLQTAPQTQTPQQYIDGSPLDRFILTMLLMAGIMVLVARWHRVARVLRMNGPLIIFFTYCAVSAFWSDYTNVALKRWVKALGDVVMVLIVLTDRDRVTAIKRLFTRVGFLLMPLSVLLIEFYPNMGRAYMPEIGQVANVGVTTNKNTLGMVCMVLGVGFVWLFIKALRAERHRTRQVVAIGSTLLIILWLLYMAHSATSLATFMLGSSLIVFLNLPGKVRPSRVHLVVGAMVLTAALAFLFPDIYASAVHALGRNTGLTGRTQLWSVLLKMDHSPWLGTGYSSFWLGNRLQTLWIIFHWQPNEAHNGYIEILLNLGWVGIVLLASLILSGYRNGIALFSRDPEAGSLRLAYIVVAVVYNFTESGFRMLNPTWIFFIFAILALPEAPVSKTVAVENQEPATIPARELVTATTHLYEGTL
jgi:exopolysaccharide production protein ExoQ